MGNIVLLDELTINQIAAGEVIERPASVVKEMVENSIDAGANNITVEIRNGGISYIRVTDNGKGIAPDDLEIAFERHATSKIRSAEDLNVVKSMGFRGEALASIAAIANVEMISKTEEQDTGYKIVVEGGDVLNKEEVGCKTGTSITVQNLFFNTPVRYKFLKKDYTESGYIEDVITRIALVNPKVAIKLINTGKTVIQTNGNGDIKSVIYSIYGKDIATGILPVEYVYEDIKVSGVIGKPEIARSNRSNQLFFVNNRYIKDRTLSAATEQAYKGLIPIGKFGFVILNIDINPTKVDVNVHPAKLEVRFEEEGKIFQSIYHAIKDTLLKNELVADTDKETPKQPFASSGLYGFRKDVTKTIEKYNDEESKIKTNVGKEQSNRVEATKTIDEVKPSINVGQGGPINTADVLEQLRKIKENLEKEVNGVVSKTEDKEVEDSTSVGVIFQEADSDEKISENPKEELEAKKEIYEDKKEQIIIQYENDEQSVIKKEENTEIEQNVENVEENSDEEAKQEKIEQINEQIKKLEEEPEEKISGEDFNEMYEKLFGTKPIMADSDIEEKNEEVLYKQDMSNVEENTVEEDSTPYEAVDMQKENLSVFEEVEEYKKPNYRFIGIAFKTYIILEIDKEMYMIDQHAAHERVLYEKVKKNYYSDQGADSQMLLLPDVITLTHKEMEIAKENMDMFVKAGFEIEEFGENTIKLTGVPTICIDLNNKEIFLETLDQIENTARTSKQEKEERFIATVACKAAVKAGMDLSMEEVDSLMNKLFELPNPFTCPHGRPTAIKMTQYEIERKFSRK